MMKYHKKVEGRITCHIWILKAPPPRINQLIDFDLYSTKAEPKAS